MDGILILAGVLLGVVCVLWARSRGQDRSADVSVGDVGRGHAIDSASGPPVLPVDHHATGDLFDDFSNGTRDAAWSSDDFVVHRICINPATGLPMISDSEVGFDVGGNPYGFSNDDLSTYHDSFGSGFGSDSLDYLDSGTDWT